MNLYQLTQQDRELYELLSGDDEIPQDQLYEILQTSEEAIHVKASRVVAMIKTFKADSEAHSNISAHHDKKAKTADNAAQRLSDYLLMCMDQLHIDKCGTLEHCAKIPTPRASLVIAEDCHVPEQYVTVKEVVNIDKNKLKADILAGSVSVEGAQIVYKRTLKVE